MHDWARAEGQRMYRGVCISIHIHTLSSAIAQWTACKPNARTLTEDWQFHHQISLGRNVVCCCITGLLLLDIPGTRRLVLAD